jgi:hypothetical protein
MAAVNCTDTLTLEKVKDIITKFFNNQTFLITVVNGSNAATITYTPDHGTTKPNNLSTLVTWISAKAELLTK